MKVLNILSGLSILAMLGLALSCSGGTAPTTSQNPHTCVTNPSHAAMITSLREVDPDRLYEMNYTADYKLDSLIEFGVDNVRSFMEFVATRIFDVPAVENVMPAFSAGCSAYAATEAESGDFLMGRNYDYCHVEKGEEVPITAILVRTAPAGGKRAIAMVDAYWLGYHKGFYSDGVSDLSMLMAAPYEMLDGVNEDGFAVCVLHLDGKATVQSEPGRKPLWTNILMRLLLDRAATVAEALDIVSNYNTTMKTPASGNFHFFLADAAGDYAILEYSYPDAASADAALPNVMKVFRGQDCNRYVTNFYVDPDMASHPTLGPLGKHGLWRYDTLRVNLEKNGNLVTMEQGMGLLKAVSQDSHPGENTSHTQWSALYDLTRRSVDISILQEYCTRYSFKVE